MRDRLKTVADDRDGMIVMTTAMVMMAVVVDFFIGSWQGIGFQEKQHNVGKKKSGLI